MADKPKYSHIRDYKQYLERFPRTGALKVGSFYSYAYNFQLNYEWDELKFYDHMPLTFIFAIDTEHNHAIGINFHHMPVRPRLLWLNRVKTIAKHVQEEIQIRGLGGRPVYKISGLNYPRVYKVLAKSKIAIRRYRLNEIRFLRKIDVRFIDEVMRYYARTWLGVNIDQIRNRYLKYKVK